MPRAWSHLDVCGSLANPRGISARGLELMGTGRVTVKPLITHHFPLEAFGKAWETFRAHEGGAYRVMLHPHPSLRLRLNARRLMLGTASSL